MYVRVCIHVLMCVHMYIFPICVCDSIYIYMCVCVYGQEHIHECAHNVKHFKVDVENFHPSLLSL